MKDARIDIKTTPEAKEKLRAKAENLSMNLSEYLIFCGFNAKINVNVGGHLDKVVVEIPLIDRMRKDGMISDQDFNRIKDGIIEKFLKTDTQ